MILDKKRAFRVLFLVIGSFLLLLLLPEFETFELKTLDYRFKLRGLEDVSQDIVLVTIDDETIEALGYPLSRDFHAALINILSEAGAKVIAFDILFTDPDRDNPQNDTLLAAMTKEAGNVCHAVGFRLMDNDPDQAKVILDGFPRIIARGFPEIQAKEMISPLQELLKAAKSIGHINIIPDSDGVVRRMPLVIRYGIRFYLSLGCQAAADYLKISQEQIRSGKEEIILGKIHIPVNRRGEMLINYDKEGGFKRYSFLKILQSFKMLKEGRIPHLNLSDFKDKLVLVGVSVSGASDLRATPFSPVAPLLETHSHIASNILKEDFLLKASKVQNIVIPLLFCLLVGILLSYSHPRKSPFIFFISLSVYGLFSLLVFKFAGIWIDVVRPGLVLFFSFIGFVSYQLLTERKRILKELPLKDAIKWKVLLNERINSFSYEVTFLDIDIADSTAIKNGEEDSDIIYSFDEYHRLLDRIAEKNKGRVLNRMGDGVIYRFQTADQAVNAAIEIKNALVAFNKNTNRLKKHISVRMGINSGKLLLDSSDEGGKVFSQTIDIAGHLQKEAKPNEILITEETFRKLGEPSLFEESGYLERDGVKIYRVNV